MAEEPTGWNRLVARLQGEVPAAQLEAFRDRTGDVLDLMEEVERRRLECRAGGVDPWAVPPATRAAFVCAWNAFVLHTLGNELLDADYRCDPRTPHFVPPATAEQVLRFYEHGEGWAARARRAHADPGYRLDVAVPAAPPAWVRVDPLPPAHMDGLLRAMRSVRDHAAAAMTHLPAAPPADGVKQGHLNRIRQLHASALARARYTEDLCGVDPAPEVREAAGEHARSALEQFHLLGQLTADPALVAGPAPAPKAESAKARSAGRRGGGGKRKRARAAEAVAFTDEISGTAFELRLAPLADEEAQMAILHILTRNANHFAALPSSTVTVRTHRELVVLRMISELKSRLSTAEDETVYEERVGFAFPLSQVENVCTSKRVGMSIVSYDRNVEVDAGAVAEFKAHCCAFRTERKKSRRAARGDG